MYILMIMHEIYIVCFHYIDACLKSPVSWTSRMYPSAAKSNRRETKKQRLDIPGSYLQLPWLAPIRTDGHINDASSRDCRISSCLELFETKWNRRRKERRLLTFYIVRHTETTSVDFDQNACCVRSFSGRQERYDFRHFLHLSGTPNRMHQLAVFEILKKVIKRQIQWRITFYNVSCSRIRRLSIWENEEIDGLLVKAYHLYYGLGTVYVHECHEDIYWLSQNENNKFCYFHFEKLSMSSWLSCSYTYMFIDECYDEIFTVWCEIYPDNVDGYIAGVKWVSAVFIFIHFPSILYGGFLFEFAMFDSLQGENLPFTCSVSSSE